MHRMPIPSTLLLCLLLALAGTAALAQPPAVDGRLTFDDLFEDGRTGERPTQVAWLPDGSALSYVWDPDGREGAAEALWRMDAATGRTEVLFSASALAEGTDGPDGTIGGDAEDEATIEAHHWAPDGSAVLIESGGDLYLWRPDAGVSRLTDTDAKEEAPTFSPNAGHVAFVREADLYVLGLGDGAEGSERALTTDGEPGVTLNAITDWVYWEEIWGRNATGYWWSPEGDHIAFYRFDETPVGEFTLLPDPTPPYPEPKVQRYPKAGTDNPGVRLGVVEVATGETVWLETDDPDGAETYLARVHWMPGADRAGVAVERVNRDQTNLDLLACDPVSGACERLLREHRDTWVDLGEDTSFLDDGRILWASDRSGWRHLYLFAADGTLIRRLTEGAWAVQSVDHAGEDGAIVTAFGTGPLGAATRRILRVPYDGSGIEELAAGSPSEGVAGLGGWHTARVAPDGRHWVHGWSAADRPGWQRLERMDGEVVAELPSRPPAFDPVELPSWRFTTIPGEDADGSEVELPAALLLPPGADPAAPSSDEPIPAIMYHYGGPASQVVADRWSSGRGLWHKLMAQRGFAVLMVDNPGSLFFGKTGAERLHRRFGPINLAAQASGATYLGSLGPDGGVVDPDRIGLWGWSGGGSNTLYCLLNAPGTWRAGVSGAPVTDWRYYDTIWTERYLDHPEDNPEGHTASSAVTYAENLEDRLLIVHGTADDNVHPQNTFAMAEALVEAGKPFEMAIYPGQKHGIRGAAERHFYEKMTEFFERWLKGE